MTSEESEIYRRIMVEQVTLQELLEKELRIEGAPQGEGKSLTIAREIKQQRAVLSRLWGRANALKAINRQ